jgi:hypothetical protein
VFNCYLFVILLSLFNYYLFSKAVLGNHLEVLWGVRFLVLASFLVLVGVYLPCFVTFQPACWFWCPIGDVCDLFLSMVIGLVLL